MQSFSACLFFFQKGVAAGPVVITGKEGTNTSEKQLAAGRPGVVGPRRTPCVRVKWIPKDRGAEGSRDLMYVDRVGTGLAGVING